MPPHLHIVSQWLTRVCIDPTSCFNYWITTYELRQVVIYPIYPAEYMKVCRSYAPVLNFSIIEVDD